MTVLCFGNDMNNLTCLAAYLEAEHIVIGAIVNLAVGQRRLHTHTVALVGTGIERGSNFY